MRVLAWCLACKARKWINEHLFRAYLYTVCATSKTEHEPQRRRESERRAFVAHKLLLLQPQQVAVVRLGSLCSSSHTAKNFAFIFDIQAQVRLFLPCGSPCVRSTSDCAVLLRSRRTKDGGIMRELPLSMRVPLVASNELAIVTKSIAFVSPPRTTDNLVENCPCLSGGRNTGVSGKRGHI